eukprot:10118619-Ditylum_brightwellii.AAC.1
MLLGRARRANKKDTMTAHAACKQGSLHIHPETLLVLAYIQNTGGHQSVFSGDIAKDDLYTSDNVCSDEQVDLLASKRNTPHLDVVENEAQFNHMIDHVENLSQSKENDLEEVYLKEADLKEANMKEANIHNYGDDCCPDGNFDEAKSVHESQGSAGRDKNYTALKKLSL